MRNLNVGLLGHVDSGKTSIAKALSTIGTTAAFDKHPQSKQRGITIDLGFSCFDLSPDLRCTVVDCPGHATLIKTVLCGAQIMDAAMVVIDATKGIQKQTAEHLMLMDILKIPIIAVLNKVDLVDEESLRIAEKKVLHLLSKLETETIGVYPFTTKSPDNYGLRLKEMLAIRKWNLDRLSEHPLLIACDHCFSVKGQGTAISGTILQGMLHSGDEIDIIHNRRTHLKKVKELQSFRVSITSATAGDRISVLVKDFPADGVDRCLIASPGSVTFAARLLVSDIQRVRFHKADIVPKSKMHITVLNTTRMAKVTFLEETDGTLVIPLEPVSNVSQALLEFDTPIPIFPNVTLMASRLDLETDSNVCRFVFTSTRFEDVSKIPISVIRDYERRSGIDRIVSESKIIGKSLFESAVKLEKHIGSPVELFGPHGKTEHCGVIKGAFGAAGKFVVEFHAPIFTSPVKLSEYSLVLKFNKEILL